MIKRKFSKNKFRIFWYCYLLFAICYLLNGCAGVPIKDTVPSYNLNNTTYLSLVPLCQARGINWQYDTFSRTIILNKDTHKINLAIGDNFVLVDGQAQQLKHPVDIYNGIVVVPLKFKEEVIDILFPHATKYAKQALLLTKIKKIVVDAGHGGNDPGAIAKTGLREKDVNLDIVARLSDLLKEDGFEVVLTRSSDNFIALSRRADIANNTHADLFVSIHSNANRVRSLKGFEIYYITSDVNDNSRALAAARSVPLNIERTCFASNSLDLKAALWDMIYVYNRGESIKLARFVSQAMDRNLDAKGLGLKPAPFFVLKGSRMPAILIEVGFLSNFKEASLLNNAYYRQQVAESIRQGIEDYVQNYTLAEN